MSQEWNFKYTGGMQYFTVPKDGEYEIRCYAPAGGKGTFSKKGERMGGGNGAYVYSRFKLKKDTELRLIVGGMGDDASSATYSSTDYDRTAGGAGGITGVFMNNRPILVASGGKGGDDLCYKSHQGHSYIVNSPTANTSSTLPSDFDTDWTPSYFSTRGSYTRGSFKVYTGYGCYSSFSSMDDTCSTVGLNSNNFILRGSVGENSAVTGQLYIELIKEETIPEIDTKVKGVLDNGCVFRSTGLTTQINTSSLIVNIPSWVDVSYHRISQAPNKPPFATAFKRYDLRDSSYTVSDGFVLSEGTPVILDSILYGVYGIFETKTTIYVRDLFKDCLKDVKIEGGRVGGKVKIDFGGIKPLKTCSELDTSKYQVKCNSNLVLEGEINL